MNDIQASLQPMFSEARATGRWFFASYQQLWFSPKELEEAQAAGRFLWGPVNWRLRYPGELVQEHQKTIETAQQAIKNVLKRVQENEG